MALFVMQSCTLVSLANPPCNFQTHGFLTSCYMMFSYESVTVTTLNDSSCSCQFFFKHYIVLLRPPRPYVSNGLQNNWLSDYIPVPEISPPQSLKTEEPNAERTPQRRTGAEPSSAMVPQSLFRGASTESGDIRQIMRIQLWYSNKLMQCTLNICNPCVTFG